MPTPFAKIRCFGGGAEEILRKDCIGVIDKMYGRADFRAHVVLIPTYYQM